MLSVTNCFHYQMCNVIARRTASIRRSCSINESLYESEISRPLEGGINDASRRVDSRKITRFLEPGPPFPKVRLRDYAIEIEAMNAAVS